MGLRLKKLGYALYDHWWEIIVALLVIGAVAYGGYRVFSAVFYLMEFDR